MKIKHKTYSVSVEHLRFFPIWDKNEITQKYYSEEEYKYCTDNYKGYDTLHEAKEALSKYHLNQAKHLRSLIKRYGKEIKHHEQLAEEKPKLIKASKERQ